MRISKFYIIAFICVALILPAAASAKKRKLVLGGKKKTENPAPVDDKIVGNTVTLQDFTIPLADENVDHSVKLVVALEFIDETSTTQFAVKKAAIRDSILSTVGVKTHSKLKKVPARIALRDELKSKINKIFGKEIVQQVYFSDFVLQ